MRTRQTRPVDGSANHERVVPILERPQPLLQMQRLVGNRATVQVLQRDRTRNDRRGGMRFDRGVPQFVMDLEADPAKRQKLDWIPSTSMGRFDAEYLPSQGELRITVRALLEFVQTVGAAGVVASTGWTQGEKDKFFLDFKTQAEAAWSGKYLLKCIKAGWEELTARVVVDFQQVNDPTRAHFHHRVQKDKGMITGIGREQNDQTPTDRRINQGNFAEQDAPVRPHDSATTCAGIASHDKGRLGRLIKAFHIDDVKFDGLNSAKIAAPSKANLDSFAEAVKRSERPGSVPVPLLVHGKTGTLEIAGTADKRAQAIAAYLTTKGLKNPSRSAGRFSAVVGAQKAVRDSKQSALAIQDEQRKLNALKQRETGRAAEVSVDDGFTWTGDPYSILAHEFGHMLGNPDEYFTYGSSVVRDAKAQQLIATGRPEDLARATQIQAMTPSGNASHATAQEGLVRTAQATGTEIPEFGPSTSSIMSAGADVLPVHYAAMWEVLGEITKTQGIAANEWQISS